MSHHQFNPEHLALTRREFLNRCGMGMGAIGLGSLLQNSIGPAAQAAAPVNPLIARPGQFPGKALVPGKLLARLITNCCHAPTLTAPLPGRTRNRKSIP